MANLVFRTPKVFDLRIEEEKIKKKDAYGYFYTDYALYVAYRPSEKGKEKRVKVEEYVGNEFKRCGKNIFSELNGEKRNQEEGLRLVRTNTRSMIKEIYSQETCSSCMVSDWEFEHPCEAYATEDFELVAAYWNDILIARCLCSVKNMARGNVYYLDHYSSECDCCVGYNETTNIETHEDDCISNISETQARFIAIQIAEIVRLMGYKKAGSPFVGCKLLNIKTRYGNCIPYIDDYDARSIVVLDKDYLIISGDDDCDGLPTDSTDGYMSF